ncbi:Hint domain-containing protein [Roseomonas sp. 18066]|uniref:Hint domain-containing protein n=1 Tax=Roseomonas sp. 18066 TaxID=2681412 RepID=UPI001357D4CE|nr:Hint domain-containing protein [Roseomonas sp. 18066]
MSGSQTVSGGGVAVNSAVGSAYALQELILVSGGAASGTTVHGGGTERVDAGGLASATRLFEGGTQQVEEGGTAWTTSVGDGGSATIAGSAVSATIDSGGLQVVESGGTASASEILSGGAELVQGGESLDATIRLGGQQEVVDGHAGGAAVFGSQTITGDGVTAGSATDTSIGAGGVQTVENDGETTGTEIASGGTQVVRDDGYASGTVIAGGGVQRIEEYGGAEGTTIASGGLQQVGDLGFVAYTTVESGGLQEVGSGGTAILTTLTGGRQDVLAEGSAAGTEIVAGTQYVAGFSVATIIHAGATQYVLDGGTAYQNIMEGLSYVSAGGLAGQNAIGHGGRQVILSGGIGSDTEIHSGGTQVIEAGGTATGWIELVGTGATLQLDTPETLGRGLTISGLSYGDRIDLQGLTYHSAMVAQWDAATNLLTVTDGATTYTLALAGSYTQDQFALSEDGSDGSVMMAATCYASGTLIMTISGAAPIDTLRPGDLVTTVDPMGLAAQPVRWIGIQTVMKRFADPLQAYPVRIRAGALAEGLPARDLLLSPDHAIRLDGLLVQAGALVNGSSIARLAAAELPERFSYYHIELPGHALVLAEGVAGESFVDNVTRRRFDNFSEFAALHGEAGPPIPELPLPRVKSARQLPAALRDRLAARAATLEAGAAAAA